MKSPRSLCVRSKGRQDAHMYCHTLNLPLPSPPLPSLPNPRLPSVFRSPQSPLYPNNFRPCVFVCLLVARLRRVHRRVERDAGHAGEHPTSAPVRPVRERESKRESLGRKWERAEVGTELSGDIAGILSLFRMQQLQGAMLRSSEYSQSTLGVP
jgi:hypothetical protein